MALGAFIEKTKILKLESIKAAMSEMAKTAPEHKRKLLQNNFESLIFGANYMKNALAAV
jgi:hypothetical protein